MSLKAIGLTLSAFFLLLAVLLSSSWGEDESLQGEINVITHEENLEKYLSPFKTTIGADYDGYRNHLYRVLTYTVHFLHGDKSFLPAISAALVYHDIALWTDSELAYLEPSAKRAETDLGVYGSPSFGIAGYLLVFLEQFPETTTRHSPVSFLSVLGVLLIYSSQHFHQRKTLPDSKHHSLAPQGNRLPRRT